MTEHDLGDGLVMRWGRPDDVDRQVALTAEVFRQYPGGPSTLEAGPWGRDLGSGTHPQSSIDRLALVEDVMGYPGNQQIAEPEARARRVWNRHIPGDIGQPAQPFQRTLAFLQVIRKRLANIALVIASFDDPALRIDWRGRLG